MNCAVCNKQLCGAQRIVCSDKNCHRLHQTELRWKRVGMSFEKQCVICSKLFQRSTTYQSSMLTCSDACQQIHHKVLQRIYHKKHYVPYKGIEKKCKTCGAKFVAHNNARTCSIECSVRRRMLRDQEYAASIKVGRELGLIKKGERYCNVKTLRSAFINLGILEKL